MAIFNINNTIQIKDPNIDLAASIIVETAYHYGIKTLKSETAKSYASKEQELESINIDSKKDTYKSTLFNVPLFSYMCFLSYAFLDKENNLITRTTDFYKEDFIQLIIESVSIESNVNKSILTTETISGVRHQQIIKEPTVNIQVNGTITNTDKEKYDQYPKDEVAVLWNIALDAIPIPIFIPVISQLGEKNNWFYIQDFKLEQTDFLNIQPFTMSLIRATNIQN